MNIQLLITFVILNIVNVILQTVKSLCTVKCGKAVAALINAIAYGLYTVVVVYTVCELPLWLKVLIVAVANFIGVWVVKWGEEKARKDKLWKIEATVNQQNRLTTERGLTMAGIPHNYIDGVGKWVIFNCYCSTKAESEKAKEILDHWGAKYFVTESKVL